MSTGASARKRRSPSADWRCWKLSDAAASRNVVGFEIVGGAAACRMVKVLFGALGAAQLCVASRCSWPFVHERTVGPEKEGRREGGLP